MTCRFAVFVALVASLSFASTASAATLPPTVGQLMWLEADQGISTTGSTVTGWTDSGTGMQLQDGTFGTPTVGSAAFTNGNHPVINFNGASGIHLNNGAALSQQTLSIFIVASLSAPQQSAIFYADYRNSTGSFGYASGISDSSTDQVKWFTGPDGAGTLGGSTGLTMTPGTPYIVTTTIDGSGKFASITDGMTLASATDGVNSIPYVGGEESGVGYLPAFGGVQALNGNIAEVLIYNTTDPTTVAQVQSYLNAKYFAPVPEPGSFILLGLGAVGLAAASRRAKR